MNSLVFCCWWNAVFPCSPKFLINRPSARGTQQRVYKPFTLWSLKMSCPLVVQCTTLQLYVAGTPHFTDEKAEAKARAWHLEGGGDRDSRAAPLAGAAAAGQGRDQAVSVEEGGRTSQSHEAQRWPEQGGTASRLTGGGTSEKWI